MRKKRGWVVGYGLLVMRKCSAAGLPCSRGGDFSRRAQRPGAWNPNGIPSPSPGLRRHAATPGRPPHPTRPTPTGMCSTAASSRESAVGKMATHPDTTPLGLMQLAVFLPQGSPSFLGATLGSGTQPRCGWGSRAATVWNGRPARWFRSPAGRRWHTWPSGRMTNERMTNGQRAPPPSARGAAPLQKAGREALC